MEDKPAGSSATAGGDSPASAEPASSSRRRAGGLKRKANALSTSNSSSTPSKRLTREKAAISQIPIHNGGPLTRARQSPNNFGSVGSSAAGGLRVQEKGALAATATATEAAAVAALEAELIKLEELKGAIEAEFEVIRSRDTNAHVVPSHCGWFSWTKIHPLEERVLPSFFNGKSQTRTPDSYMEIRNCIVKKFHLNPNVQIELKDLSELEVADIDAKQEVLEFLDYWGLINFHPHPPSDSSANADGDGASNKDSLLEKLFRFEAIRPRTPVVPKPNVSTPALPSGLFPESAIAEELVRPEGPSVEYHCNSCSADCSRKRYHCQTQADYDLCADCFNNGKFGSDMSSSDFILMEPAEAPGLSGGKWTDQETLLLLEALELYKENWNEIAEHVATKTKAQCILHFVQMPIEDVFFDCENDVDDSSKETTDPPATIDETSALKDGTETGEDKASTKEDQPLTSPTEDVNEVKNCQENAKLDNANDSANEAVIDEETSKSKDITEVKAAPQTDENFALKALTEAFEAVGYPSTPENRLSFAEVGNPVMALAAFLGRLVGRDVATVSAQSSLKSLNSDSPGMELAARHCFLLEDPPDDQKGPADIDWATKTANVDASKDKKVGQTERGNDSPSNDHNNKKIEDSPPEEKQPPGSSNEESNDNVDTANNAGIAIPHEETAPGKLKASNESVLKNESEMGILKESNEISSKSECLPSSMKETEGSLATACSHPAGVPEDVEMVPDLRPFDDNEPCQSVALVSVEEHSAAEASKDVDMVSDSLPSEKNGQQQKMKSNSAGDHSHSTEAPKYIEMLSSLPSETKEPQQPVASNSVVENGATAAEDQNDSKKEKPDYKEIKIDHNVDKIKSAAVSALSAAAVKAKLLANQEEHQIRQLAASLIEKQLHKLETKLAFFNEMDHVIMRVREQLDRTRQKLYHERAQIIAARLGIPPSSSKAMPPALPTNRVTMNFVANSIPRPPMNMNSQRPPMSRPIGPLPTPSNPFVSTTTAGNSIRPSGQDKLSPVVTK